MTIGTLSRVGLLPQKRERLLFFGTKVNDPLIFLHVCVCVSCGQRLLLRRCRGLKSSPMLVTTRLMSTSHPLKF